MKIRIRFPEWIPKLIAVVARFILRTRYKIKISGSELMETKQPILFLPNHQALIDPVIILGYIHKYSSVRPAITSKYFDIPLLKQLFKWWGAIRVSDLENGSRNVNVLNEVARANLKGLRRGRNMVLYPSGQIAAHGLERIVNKKSAQYIVSRIPDDVMVVGVRIRGLWGSMFSKARTGKSPDFIMVVLRAFYYVFVNLFFFLPKRKLSIEFVDITDWAVDEAQKGRKEFNTALENFYNEKGEEPVLFLSHYFWKKKVALFF